MIHPLHLRRLIRETLEQMGPPLSDPAAVELLLLIAAHESRMGTYLWQAGSDGQPRGPALGIYQMEAATHADLWQSYLRYHPQLASMAAWTMGWRDRDWRDVDLATLIDAGETELVRSLAYATVAARLQLWRHPERLPAADDVEGLAGYWHRAWCKGCAGTVRQAAEHYRRFAA